MSFYYIYVYNLDCPSVLFFRLHLWLYELPSLVVHDATAFKCTKRNVLQSCANGRMKTKFQQCFDTFFKFFLLARESMEA